jgi:hypothetical protein
MKRIVYVSALLIAFTKGYCQTVTADANGILNIPKIVLQTTAGQSFFTGHQAGASYANNLAIFRAWTDNPNGTQNYYFDGSNNGTINYFVRADGLGYFGNSVGIGTSTPSSYFHGGNNKVLEIFNSSSTLNSQSHLILSSGSTLDGNSAGSISWLSKNSTGSQGMAYISSQLQGNGTTNAAGNLVFGTSNGTGVSVKMMIDKSGSIGIGTGLATPATRLHVIATGASTDGDDIHSYNGDGMAIQANTGGRLTAQGAQLEFVIPANTDGSNPWGQGRIITVAGNTGNGNATGKMIIGTRRNFNKLGTGAQWYYGNDIVIDGNGYVGIGTATPREALSVNGKIRSQEVKVEVVNWPDYVFKPTYKLASLIEIKKYIDENQHLPDLPSALEIEKEGLSLGEMNKLLTKKVEELTLYLIISEQQSEKQSARIKSLEEKVEFLVKKLQ